MGNLNFELKILDEDFRKIAFWKFPMKQLSKYLRIINNKYNLGLKIKETKKADDDDLGWAM